MIVSVRLSVTCYNSLLSYYSWPVVYAVASAVLPCTILLYLIVLQDQMTGSGKFIGRIHVDICCSSFVAFGINGVSFYTAAYLKHLFDNIHPK